VKPPSQMTFPDDLSGVGEPCASSGLAEVDGSEADIAGHEPGERGEVSRRGLPRAFAASMLRETSVQLLGRPQRLDRRGPGSCFLVDVVKCHSLDLGRSRALR